MKHDANLIDPARRMQDAPRCHAKAKSTGQPCKAPAVKGWSVCRAHGARGGAPMGKHNGAWRHGGRSLELTETRRLIAELTRLTQSNLRKLL